MADGNAAKRSGFNIAQSKFVRSIVVWIVAVFLIVSIVIVVIVFGSFTSEIKKSVIAERQKQLETVESTMSTRMEEVSSIAYSISNDEAFYIAPVTKDKYSGYEMSKILSRYLVGNDFIEHLAYYRLSEPDTIYVSSGELSFREFWASSFRMDSNAIDDQIQGIQSCTQNTTVPFLDANGNCLYLANVRPLPMFSKTPQAFVLTLIPYSGIEPILQSQLMNYHGKITVYDANGSELLRLSNLEADVLADPASGSGTRYFTSGGSEYVVQQRSSAVNGWTYVSVLRMDDMISDVANRQIVFILLLLALMLVAIASLVLLIVKRYQPINRLALTMSDKNGPGSVIDEESLLKNRFAALKDDSEQKQRFEAAYYAANAANQAKSTFLSSMSHDIRTPMNAIVGMIEIADKHLDDPIYVRECLQKARLSSQYLLDIINNVLDMSRIESGKFELSKDEIDLPKLVYRIVNILNQSVEVKSQKLFVEVEHLRNERFIGDGVRLSQVFMNILSNAVKFTPNGGTIRFVLRQNECPEEGYGDYVFTFTDTGVGMSQEFIGHLFETFTRDESTHMTKTEGTGLGMSIAKNLVEMMGGTIECESEQGAGTTFTVKLRMPLVKEAVEGDALGGARVMLIGAEAETLGHQSSLFEELGARAQTAHSAEEASKLARAADAAGQGYDFVLINQLEGDRNGALTIARLRDEPGLSDAAYILAARDLLSVNRSTAFNGGVAMIAQIPLFRSTALCILNRAFKTQSVKGDGTVVDLTGAKVLLAEDNQINMEIARALIGETNATVVAAANGKEAVELFKQHEAWYFDVIMMDVQMPVMNGYEATAAIRSIRREDAPLIPIYAMTANTFDEDVRQVKDAGMNGHLGKPYSPEELFDTLKQAVEQSEAARRA